MTFLAVRDEVPDDEFVAGWNAYLQGDYGSLWGSTDAFLRGFEAARDQAEASMSNMKEVEPGDLG